MLQVFVTLSQEISDAASIFVRQRKPVTNSERFFRQNLEANLEKGTFGNFGKKNFHYSQHLPFLAFIF